MSRIIGRNYRKSDADEKFDTLLKQMNKEKVREMANRSWEEQWLEGEMAFRYKTWRSIVGQGVGVMVVREPKKVDREESQMRTIDCLK